MAEQQLERSMLDGKDREQLHAIAGAMGIKGVTRLRKADLVDAILEAASGNGGAAGNGTPTTTNGARKATRATKATKTAKADPPAADTAESTAAPARRAVRSKRASELETEGDLAALAAEEDALAGGDEPDVAPRPMRRSGASTSTATESAAPAPSEPESTETATTPTQARDGGGDARRGDQSRNAPSVDPEDERASFGEGNRTGRRRRRRGRDRNAGGGGGGGGGGNQGNNERDRIPDERNEQFSGEPIDIQGLLDLRDEGYGFLRTTGYLAGRNDVYVSASQVRRFALRKGDFVKGQTRPPASNE
jgi:transcription termination factor Rho